MPGASFSLHTLAGWWWHHSRRRRDCSRVLTLVYSGYITQGGAGGALVGCHGPTAQVLLFPYTRPYNQSPINHQSPITLAVNGHLIPRHPHMRAGTLPTCPCRCSWSPPKSRAAPSSSWRRLSALLVLCQRQQNSQVQETRKTQNLEKMSGVDELSNRLSGGSDVINSPRSHPEPLLTSYACFFLHGDPPAGCDDGGLRYGKTNSRFGVLDKPLCVVSWVQRKVRAKGKRQESLLPACQVSAMITSTRRILLHKQGFVLVGAHPRIRKGERNALVSECVHNVRLSSRGIDGKKVQDKGRRVMRRMGT